MVKLMMMTTTICRQKSSIRLMTVERTAPCHVRVQCLLGAPGTAMFAGVIVKHSLNGSAHDHPVTTMTEDTDGTTGNYAVDHASGVVIIADGQDPTVLEDPDIAADTDATADLTPLLLVPRHHGHPTAGDCMTAGPPPVDTAVMHITVGLHLPTMRLQGDTHPPTELLACIPSQARATHMQPIVSMRGKNQLSRLLGDNSTESPTEYCEANHQTLQLESQR